MTLKEKVLYHQIHPLKLTADIGCEPISLYYLWQHKLLLGLLTHFLPPVAATVYLLSFANLEPYKNSSAGAFLDRHMTRTVESIRFAGDIIMVVGSWFQKPAWIGLGVVIVLAAWSSGFLRRASST